MSEATTVQPAKAKAAKPNQAKADKAAAPALRAKLPKAPAGKTPEGAPNPMMQPRIAKVTVNIGVGDGGEKLEKAERILAKLSGAKPMRTLGKEMNRELNVRVGAPIGVKVTLRGDLAEDFVRRALYSRKNKVYEYSFDNQGNLQFGVADYTNFEGERYDPELGVFGMDVAITLEKPGHRIKHRRLLARKVPMHHRVTREEAKAFLAAKFQIEVI
ncbi:MAG: 50S ribosomal protein L5 [Halobacteriales archaeon]|nr:50S ribosomal protein L5 [Halobacteriales archaeon]